MTLYTLVSTSGTTTSRSSRARAQSDAGLNFKVVRANGVIRIYAQNGEEWVRLDEGGTAGDLTIGNDVKNEIKFLATGNSYTFSDISVSTAVES